MTAQHVSEPSPSFHRPSELAKQAGTMMCWPTESSVTDDGFYSGAGIDIRQTRAEIAEIARTIAKYQPLHLFVLDPQSAESDPRFQNTGFATAKELLGTVDNVTIHTTPNIDSLWARDTGPLNVISQSHPIQNTWSPDDDPGLGLTTTSTTSTTVGLDLHFNQWGRKQPISQDAYLAPTACQQLNMSCVSAPFTGEGGALEVDGRGTLLATASSLLNPNRNPGMARTTLEGYFRDYLGVTKTIWLPGVRGRDITDDHIDALARFGGRDEEDTATVLLSRATERGDGVRDREYEETRKMLEGSTDAIGRRILVVEVPEPDPRMVLGEHYREKEGPCVSYVNFLAIEGAVVMAKFGDDEADAAAKRIVENAFPGRVVEQVYLHQLALQGGGIHCSTQQILPRT